jgi:hypothetical protein
MTFNTASWPLLRSLCLGLLATAAVAAPTAAHAAPISYGVVTQGYPQDVRDFEFRLMGRGDIATVRFLAHWPLIQKAPGPCLPGPYEPPANECDWSSLDRMVGAAAARGTASLPFLYGAPGWTESNDGEPESVETRVPPIETEADRAAWQAFVRAALQRYGPGGVFWAPDGGYASQHPGAAPLPIRDWQVWNEPSSPAYYWPKPSAAGYADLLGLAADVIREQDPSARILLAGLFGTPGGGPGGIFLPRFLDRLYDVQGVEEDFDAVALHPYSPGIDGMKAQIELARREMRQAKDAATDLWVTELGWASDGPKEIQAVKSERGQARTLTRAFMLLRANRGRWNVIGVNWFSLRDTPKRKSPCPGCPYTGLLERDGEPKPAWRAFVKFSG